MRKVSCVSFRPSFALRLLAFCVSSPPIVIAIVIDKTLTTSPPYPFPRPHRCHLSTHPPPPSTPISHLNLVVVVVNVFNFDVFTRHWTIFGLVGSFSHIRRSLDVFIQRLSLSFPFFPRNFSTFRFLLLPVGLTPWTIAPTDRTNSRPYRKKTVGLSRGWPWLLGCAHHHISGMSSHLCFSSNSLHVRSFIAFHLFCAMFFVFLTLLSYVLGSMVSFNSRYPRCAISTGSTGKLVNNCALGFVGPACIVLFPCLA